MRKKGTLPLESDFFTEFGKKVFSLMSELSMTDNFSDSMLGESLTPDEMSRLEKIKITRRQVTSNTIEILYDCLETLKRARSADEKDVGDIIKEKRKKKN